MSPLEARLVLLGVGGALMGFGIWGFRRADALYESWRKTKLGPAMMRTLFPWMPLSWIPHQNRIACGAFVVVGFLLVMVALFARLVPAR